MTTAPLDQPYRGSADDRPRGVPLPPDHLPLFRAGQLRKSWKYVSFWSPELSFCASRVKVGLLQQEYWGIWDRSAQQFRQRSHFFTHRVQHELNRVAVHDGDADIDVTFEPANSFELYRPAARAYIWAHKDYCPGARGTVAMAIRGARWKAFFSWTFKPAITSAILNGIGWLASAEIKMTASLASTP